MDFLIAPLIGGRTLPLATLNAQRAHRFFSDLLANRRTGLVTPTAFNELIHIAVKFRYQQEWLRVRSSHLQKYGRPIKGWSDVYKQDETILQGFLTDLQQLRPRLIASGLLFVSPGELSPITSGRTYDEELVHLVGTYGLDSNDALLLMEAQRYGVHDIVTLDADLRRAQADFNIYTWL